MASMLNKKLQKLILRYRFRLIFGKIGNQLFVRKVISTAFSVDIIIINIFANLGNQKLITLSKEKHYDII